MLGGGIFHDFVLGTWDEAKGYIKEELEQLRAALNTLSSMINSSTGTLDASFIPGESTGVTRYIANSGPKFSPRWDRVNLANGVKAILSFSFIQGLSGSRLAGRGSTGAGTIEEIELGTGLVMDGTTLNVTGTSVEVDPAGALDGDGTLATPLAVKVDGTTIIINGSNELEAVGATAIVGFSHNFLFMS